MINNDDVNGGISINLQTTAETSIEINVYKPNIHCDFIVLEDLSGIEVSGQMIKLVTDDLGMWARLGILYPSMFGITNVTANRWYPVEKVVKLLAWVQKKSPKSLMQFIGRKIFQRYHKDILWEKVDDVVEKMNVIYHKYHRINGQLMYDEKNKYCFKGIGGFDISINHLDKYGAKKQGPYEITIMSNTIYPDEFNYGIIQGIARMFGDKDLWVERLEKTSHRYKYRIIRQSERIK